MIYAYIIYNGLDFNPVNIFFIPFHETATNFIFNFASHYTSTEINCLVHVKEFSCCIISIDHIYTFTHSGSCQLVGDWR